MLAQAMRIAERTAVAHQEHFVFQIGVRIHDALDFRERQVAWKDDARCSAFCVMGDEAFVEDASQRGDNGVDTRFADGFDEALARHDNALSTCVRDAGQILALDLIEHIVAIECRVEAHEPV